MGRTRVRGGRVFVGGDLVEADIVVEAEAISGLVGPGETVVDAVDLDATGRIVLPGIVDLHCHTREPGYTNKEDFLTASMAGAAGGVTTMIDMPNVEPPTDTVETFETKRAIADRKSIIDWGHFVAGTNLGEIEGLAAAGATGYKIFQVSGAYPHDPRLAINEDARLLKAFRAIAETGLPCVVHPFNQSLFEALSEEAFAQGKPRDATTFAEVYTSEAIWHTAVNSLLNLQALSGVRLHLVHSHSAGSLRLIRAAKARGQCVTAAVDPKYYHLTRQDLDRDPPRACPGGFVTEDRERMNEIWQSLNDGTIDAIDADHAPHTLEEIAAQMTNAWNAAMGSPQYDWQYSIALTDVAAGKLPLGRAVELLAEGPARILGCYPRKGSLLPGSDADLVIVDAKRQTILTDDGLFTKVHWTPYLGWTVTGYVELTMLRGSVIARNREILASPGFGRFVPGVPQ
jgi:dihydroorotase